MRCKNSSHGFTLIETVVVSVIVAILAAVAIPIYTGFIKDQKQTTVDNLAETGAAAANAYFRRTNTDPDSAKLGLYIPGSGYNVTVTSTTVTVSKGGFTSTPKSYK